MRMRSISCGLMMAFCWLVTSPNQFASAPDFYLILKADTGAKDGKPDQVGAFVSAQENLIYETAAPKPHVFTVSRAETKP
jgi:hypothetical protein